MPKIFYNERNSSRSTSKKGLSRTGRTTDTRLEAVDYSLQEALEIFVKAKQAEGVRPRTVDDYYKHFKYLTRYLVEEHPQVRLIGDLTADVIRGYIIYLRDERTPYEGDESRERDRKGLSTNTINIRMRTLRTMCKFWHEEGIIEINPMANIKQLREDIDDEVPGLTDEEVKALLAAPDVHLFAGWRDKIMMLYLLDTGVRIGELVGLKLEHIDPRRSTVFIPSSTAKNRRGRDVPVSREVMKLLRELHAESQQYFGQCEYVFVSAFGEPITADTVRRRLWQYAKETGVERATPHMFRHTFCRNYILNGGDIFTLQRIVDHADISTTRRYVQMDRDHIQAQHNKYSPVFKFIKKRR